MNKEGYAELPISDALVCPKTNTVVFVDEVCAKNDCGCYGGYNGKFPETTSAIYCSFGVDQVLGQCYTCKEVIRRGDFFFRTPIFIDGKHIRTVLVCCGECSSAAVKDVIAKYKEEHHGGNS